MKHVMIQDGENCPMGFRNGPSMAENFGAQCDIIKEVYPPLKLFQYKLKKIN